MSTESSRSVSSGLLSIRAASQTPRVPVIAARIVATASAFLVAAAIGPGAVAKEFPANRLFAAASTPGPGDAVAFGPNGAVTPYTLTGTGPGGLPWGIAFGPDGLVYVSYLAEQVVMAFDAAGAPVTTIGPVSELHDPRGIAFGPEGHLYVCSEATNRVLAFTPTGTLV